MIYFSSNRCCCILSSAITHHPDSAGLDGTTPYRHAIVTVLSSFGQLTLFPHRDVIISFCRVAQPSFPVDRALNRLMVPTWSRHGPVDGKKSKQLRWRTFETPSCFSKIDATFRRSKTFADPFSPSASSCFLNHQHRRMGKAGWPSLSICALHVNLPPMTIDASVDVGGNALLDFGVV